MPRIGEILRKPAVREFYHVLVGTELRRDIRNKLASYVDAVIYQNLMSAGAHGGTIRQISPHVLMMATTDQASGAKTSQTSPQLAPPPEKPSFLKKTVRPLLGLEILFLASAVVITYYGTPAALLGTALPTFGSALWGWLGAAVNGLPGLALGLVIWGAIAWSRSRGAKSAELEKEATALLTPKNYSNNQSGLDAARTDLAALERISPQLPKKWNFERTVANHRALLEAKIIEITEALASAEVGKTYIGQKGKYLLIEKIGAGGMAIVYKATDEQGNEVAVKVLREEEIKNQDVRERFIKEVDVLRDIQNETHTPFVVAGIDSGTTDVKAGGIDQPFFVMEYVEGKTLAKMIADKEVATTRAVELIPQIAEGLAAGHRVSRGKNYVHRDLKPQNILVTKDAAGNDLVKITDYGLAKDASDPRTQSGVIMGTIRYLAPEGVGSRQSDIYALGLTFYEALCGSLPSDLSSNYSEWVAYMQKLDRSKPMPFDYALDGVPSKYRPVIEKATHPDKARRYASCEALIDDLTRITNNRPPAGGERASSVVLSALVICTESEYLSLRDLEVAPLDLATAEAKKSRVVEILGQLNYDDEWYLGLMPRLTELEGRIYALSTPPTSFANAQEAGEFLVSFLNIPSLDPPARANVEAKIRIIERDFSSEQTLQGLLASVKLMHGIS